VDALPWRIVVQPALRSTGDNRPDLRLPLAPLHGSNWAVWLGTG